jgi:hypothetical protein
MISGVVKSFSACLYILLAVTDLALRRIPVKGVGVCVDMLHHILILWDGLQVSVQSYPVHHITEEILHQRVCM